ncbi:MAG: hypothetical protein WCA31_04940 [Acidimicrobiales bacterium]
MTHVILAAEVVGGLVVALVLVGAGLRVRKVRRDARRDRGIPVDRRLVAPPPSPYAPSKGFRLLDESGEPIARPPVQRPRLDPERPYIFSDSATHGEDALPSHLRHSDDWFLSRSAHRSTSSVVLRVVGAFVVVAVVVATVATYYLNHSNTPPTTTTSTTTTTTAPSTTTTAPTSFRPISTSGEDASYSIPATRYRVTVTGARGETWAQYNMGPAKTLEWQGAVAQGANKSLVMTGDSEITLGSPSSASVVVDGRPVVFPSPLPVTLVLVFNATGSTNSA